MVPRLDSSAVNRSSPRSPNQQLVYQQTIITNRNRSASARSLLLRFKVISPPCARPTSSSVFWPFSSRRCLVRNPTLHHQMPSMTQRDAPSPELQTNHNNHQTVWVKRGICSADSILNILLLILGYVRFPSLQTFPPKLTPPPHHHHRITKALTPSPPTAPRSSPRLVHHRQVPGAPLRLLLHPPPPRRRARPHLRLCPRRRPRPAPAGQRVSAAAPAAGPHELRHRRQYCQ